MSKDCIEPFTDRRILRRDEVEHITGFKRSHLYSLMKDGRFPTAKRIGLRAVGWDSHEIHCWISERLAEQSQTP